MNRAASAAELQLQEIARLRDAIVPRIETLRGMSLSGFRSLIALTLERFGHHIVTDPTAPDLVTTKLTDKFVTECAPPATLTPISIVALRRLHDVVVATGASRGFLITTHSFTAEAEKYAEGAPLDLIDGRRLIKILNQSRKHILLPQLYKALCVQCGDIVEHKLDDDEARPCQNGHPVAPSIARAMLIPPRRAIATDQSTTPVMVQMSRSQIRAHNYRVRAKVFKKRPGR